MNTKSKKTVSPKMIKLNKLAVKLSKWCSYAGGAAVILVMLISVVDVVMAKVFKASFPSATEWVTYLNILIVYAPLAYVELDRGHTQVDILSGRAPRWITTAIRYFSLFLSTGVFAFLSYTGVKLVISQLLSGEKSSSDAHAILAFNLSWFGIIYALGCILACLSFIWTIIREFTHTSILGCAGSEAENNVICQKGANK